MTNNPETHYFTQGREFTGAGPERPIQYTVPFHWGTLRVTQAAAVFYDLVPLVGGVVNGESDALASSPGESPPFRVDVFLLTPEQIDSARLAPQVEKGQDTILGWLMIHPVAELHSEGIAFGFAPSNNADSVMELARQELSSAAQSDREGLEELRGTVRLYFIHSLSNVIEEVVKEVVPMYLSDGNENGRIAEETAVVVADSVHDTFCPGHFNNLASLALGNSV